MRKSNFALGKRNKICVGVLALIVGLGGITYNNEAEARDRGSVVTQEELELVFGKQDIKTVDIFSRDIDVMVNNQGIEPTMPVYNLKLPKKYQSLIWQLCLQNDLSYELALAVFHYESRFDPRAVNNANKDRSHDSGIAQLNSRYIDTYKNYGIQYCNLPKDQKFDVFDADHSIRAGIGTMVYLRNHWRKRGVPEEVMIEYLTGSFNLGLEGFRKYVKQTGKIEREYSRQIHLRKEKLERSNTLS